MYMYIYKYNILFINLETSFFALETTMCFLSVCLFSSKTLYIRIHIFHFVFFFRKTSWGSMQQAAMSLTWRNRTEGELFEEIAFSLQERNRDKGDSEHA